MPHDVIAVRGARQHNLKNVNIDLPRQFAPNDIDLLTTLAEIAGNAIQRTRLHEQTEQQLGDAGVSTRSETGESDPLAAIEDALNTFKADRIVLLGSSGSDRYKEVDAETVRERFGIPVDTAASA